MALEMLNENIGMGNGNEFVHKLTKDTDTLVRLDTHSFENVHDYTVHQILH